MSRPPQNNFNLKPSVNLGLVNIADKLFQQGYAFLSQGRFEQARQDLEKVISVNPKHFHALHLLGIISAEQKNYQIAINLFDKAVKLQRNDPVLYCNRGNVYTETNQIENALINYNKAIALNPNYAEAYCFKSIASSKLSQFEDALESADKALSIKPDFAEAYVRRGNALKELKRFDEALISFDKAIELKFDYAETYNDRANVLIELNRFDEALKNYELAIEYKRDHAEFYSNRGNVLKELKRFDEAILSFCKAIELKPDYADAYWNKSLALLLIGNFEKGFQLYEWRWKKFDFTSPNRHFSEPLWLGAESLANKTILLHAEQGIGDTIQFCRYVALVKKSGARVLLEIPKYLMTLLEDLQDVDELLEKGQPLPHFDYQCPLLSLPLAFKTNINSIPSPTPYLSSKAGKLDTWSQRLGEKSKPRIGLVWNGNALHKNDRNRSMTLAEIIHILPQDFEYVSLQKEVRDSDQESLTNSNILHFGEQMIDFTDTAVLCDLMDIIITVDTSVAHLAGALGKPTWILLSFIPDWRWLLDRLDSPWYSSVKLYRQGEDRDWGPVLQQITTDLNNNAFH